VPRRRRHKRRRTVWGQRQAPALKTHPDLAFFNGTRAGQIRVFARWYLYTQARAGLAEAGQPMIAEARRDGSGPACHQATIGYPVAPNGPCNAVSSHPPAQADSRAASARQRDRLLCRYHIALALPLRVPAVERSRRRTRSTRAQTTRRPRLPGSGESAISRLVGCWRVAVDQSSLCAGSGPTSALDVVGQDTEGACSQHGRGSAARSS
jgi:hypothetical protein